MFELSDFYDYCKQNQVDVIPFNRLPTPAMTVRDGGRYAVGLNMQRIRTTRLLRTAAMHENGHLRTGALHKVVSPYQIVAQAEHKADADSFRQYLPPEELQAAMRAGYTEPWQLAEYFDLEESYIRKALAYWTECRGVDFNRDPG
ncbi:MAG: hypothetical protein U0L91_07340 [Gemmiger sp.]|uniref:hypothetical protein n=1 Tax=Gemmiger sp. TaxID=2049027 RepID=UPI002E7A4ED9|nr:hypothetical protein [Gemmiger sp.]MEE0801077.1 hypothetical protein [Gemmiger sp.]